MIAFLRKNWSSNLQKMFVYAYHPNWHPLLKPKDLDEYRPAEALYGLAGNSLHREAPKLHVFFQNGNPNFSDVKKKRLQNMHLQICESLCPEEAVYFEKIITKTFYIKGLDYEVINLACGKQLLLKPEEVE